MLKVTRDVSRRYGCAILSVGLVLILRLALSPFVGDRHSFLLFLIAIGLVAVWGASLVTVILAILVPEVPRIVRLVRSIVLTVREEPYVEAAISLGTRLPLLLIRHVMPSTIAPMIVQGTFVCASAILTEAILSFLGIGIPSDTPSWGNIMADGRQFFRISPHGILFPGAFLAATVLAVNMLGDGLRDRLDPKLAKRV